MKKRRGCRDTQVKRSRVSVAQQEVRRFQGKFFGAAVIHQCLSRSSHSEVRGRIGGSAALLGNSCLNSSVEAMPACFSPNVTKRKKKTASPSVALI